MQADYSCLPFIRPTPEGAGDEQLPVGQFFDLEWRASRLRSEGSIELPLLVQPSQIPALQSIDSGKVTSHENLAVSLRRYRINRVVRPGIERTVHRAVAVQARKMAAFDSSDGGEFAPDKHFSIPLQGDREDPPIAIGIKSCTRLLYETSSRRHDNQRCRPEKHQDACRFWKGEYIDHKCSY